VNDRKRRTLPRPPGGCGRVLLRLTRSSIDAAVRGMSAPADEEMDMTSP